MQIKQLLNPSETAKEIGQRPVLHRSVRIVHGIGWVLVLFLAIYDIVLARDSIDGNTWSELMRTYGQRHLILPWGMGVIVGHLFHNRSDARSILNSMDRQQAFNVIFWISGVLLIVGVLMFLLGAAFPPIPPIVMTLVAGAGLLAGYTLWPIERDPTKWGW